MSKSGHAIPAVLIAILAINSSALAKKVLFIDSYHEGYAWSDGLTEGVKSVIQDKAELKIYRMDTKNNPSDEFKIKAAAEAKSLIESWQPDIVIAADDNASKYLIEPHYKGSEIPFVFCGVNWDCSSYGFPTTNICGMEEVGLIKPLIAQMSKYAKGDRIGYLSVDNLTARNEAKNYKSKFGIEMVEKYAKTADEWKALFTELQDSVDLLFLDNNAGIQDWDDAAIKQFVAENIKIPTGTILDWMMPYSLFGYTKLPSEQGAWAADAALEILNGKTPTAIGVAQNKKGKLFINLPISQKLGAKIPLKTLKTAEIVK